MLSRLAFSYCNGILATGSRKILVQDDLWDVSQCAGLGLGQQGAGFGLRAGLGRA